MNKAAVLLAWISAALMLSVACATDQAEPQDAETETLGAVNFPTSCIDVTDVAARVFEVEVLAGAGGEYEKRRLSE